MEGFKFIKIILFSFSVLLLVIFLISCQSPIFQIPYNAKNDLKSQAGYYGKYVSKNNVGQNQNEKLNVMIRDTDVSIYIWIGGSSFSDDKNFQVKNSNIDGEFPHYAFNNEEIVGTLTFISQTKINISFATMYKPNLNIQNIICNKTDNK